MNYDMSHNDQRMTEEQQKAYFNKLELTGPVAADLETLTRLHHQHLLKIPYENLDSINGRITSLSHEDLFHKLIEQPRGGICFELNGLYAWLLESVGFEVDSYACRIISKSEPVQMRRHRVMCVKLGTKRYFTDVGVNSERPRVPLLLEEDFVQRDGCCDYRFTRDSFWGWLLWQREEEKPWKRLLGFTEEPQLDLDFVMPTVFCDLHPLSPINKGKKLSIYREDCSVTIRGDELKFYARGKVRERRKIESPEELRKILAEYFHIVIPGPLKNEGMEAAERSPQI